MRTGITRKTLLIMALALSQWLVMAHALQHSALAPDQACQICLHAPGVDTGAIAPLTPTLALSPGRSVAPAPLLPARRQIASAYYPIRAPPVPA